MPVLWYCRKGIILWVLHSAGKAACTLQVPHVLMRNGVCMYFLSFQLACFCSVCNFQLLYFSRRASQTLGRVIFICSVSWVRWRFSGSLLFVLPSDYRLPLAGNLEIFWTYMVGGTMSWCEEPMRFWHLIMTLLKVKQGHFETPILVLLNFSSIITAKGV